MGVFSGLVVSPCVAPPLIAALAYAASTGELARGGLALYALGFGMSSPLLIIGLVGGPLSYMAGESLGAIALTGVHWVNTALIALEWACGMPLLVYLTERAESWNNFRQLKTEFKESGEVA